MRAGRTGDPRRGRAVATALLAGLLAGLAAGCVTAPDDVVPAPGPTPSPTATAGAPEVEIGPVSALLGELRGLGEESEADRRRRVEAVEAAIAACMVAEGFAYEPLPYVPTPSAALEPTGDAGAAGYGIASSNLVAPAPPGGLPLQVDPNAAALDAMSDAERAAWDLTLYGPGQGEAYAAGEEPYDWTRYGCVGRAQHDVPGAILPQFDASAFETLDAEIRAMTDAVATDPALAPVVAAWGACMAAAGHPGYTGVDQPRAEIQEAAGLIWQDTYGSLAVDLSSSDYTTSAAYLEAGAESQRRYAELAEIEVPLAEADLGCLDEVGYADALAAARLAAEQDFFATHRAELEAYRAAYEEFAATLGSG